MKNTLCLISVLSVILTLTNCRRDAITEVPEESKINVIWQNSINSGEYYFGSDNIHLFEDLIIVSGNKENVPGNAQESPTIRAFTQGDGSRVWSHEIDKDKYFHGIRYSFVMDNIFIGYFSDGIIAFDLNTQTELWSIVDDPDFFARSVPTIFEDRIYRSYERYESNTEVAVSHNITTGLEEVHFSIPSERMTSPVFWTNPDGELHKIVVARSPVESASQSTIYVYNSVDELIYTIEEAPIIGLSNFAIRHPIVSNDKIIIQGDLICEAYDLISKEKLWSYDSKRDHNFGMTIPLVIDNKLILNMGERDIVCLNINSGEELWKNINQCKDCSLNFLYNSTDDVLLFSDSFEASLIALNTEDGSKFECLDEMPGSGYNILYNEETDSYYSRTSKEIFEFKLEQ